MDSLSAQLLTDPYTALHDASEQAVHDAGGDLRDVVRDVLGRSPDPGHDTGTAAGREALTLLIGEALAPLVARYAHAITGVRTLRALLNAGSLEFSAAGTVERMSETVEEVAELCNAGKWDPKDTGTFMLAAIAAGKKARELLADFRDAAPNPHDIGIAGRSVETLPEPEAPDPRQAVADASLAEAETVLETKDADEALDPLSYEARLEAAEKQRTIEAADAYDALEAPADVVAGDEAITVAVDAPNDPTKAPALELGRVGALRSASYPAPYYEVYRADTGRQAPHCTTRTYDSALSYCRASHGTPWHILEIDEQGAAILVTDVKIDGTVVNLTDRIIVYPAKPELDIGEPARAAAAAEASTYAERLDQAGKRVVAETLEQLSGVWFTVRRGDAPGGGDFCRTPHYAIALEYCQGSPGVPWAIWQTVNGDTGSVIVTTVDEAGDVTEVGERGAS